MSSLYRYWSVYVVSEKGRVECVQLSVTSKISQIREGVEGPGRCTEEEKSADELLTNG